MRTNIEIDDQLLRQVMQVSGVQTKKAAVEAALKLVVKLHGQTSIRRLRGKVEWNGNLDESRAGRIAE